MAEFRYTQRVRDALDFSKEAHTGQFYGDEEYWTHPYRVALKLTCISGAVTENQFIIALLHDVVEDTEYTIDDIRERFGIEVAEGVELLTKDKTLSYSENIDRIIKSGNVDAILVKLSDNMVNMSGDKSHMSAERREKLNDRYAKSVLALSTALLEYKGD